MKRILVCAVCLLQVSLLFAHVGNSNITLEGMAGKYHVLVNIQPPDVIPGTATIKVFTAPGLTITARPVYFLSGKDGAPNPDVLTPVSGQPGQYETLLWLMSNGSASIQFDFNGPQGKAEMLVPVVAVSTVTKKMPPSTAYMLLSLGIILFILLMTIVGSSVSDGIIKPGLSISSKAKRTKAIAFIITGLLCSVIVYGGHTWWKSVAKKTSQYVFRPMHANYTFNKSANNTQLHFALDSANAQRKTWLPYIIPDHGKIMHTFLVSLPEMNVFSHLHPVRTGPVNFSVGLPQLAPGKYLIYSDIVYNSGFTETIKDTLTINNNITGKQIDSLAVDPDDVTDISGPLSFDKELKNETIGGKTGELMLAKDSFKILLESPKKDKHYFSGELNQLQFSFWDKNNQPLVPDLYMGMEGHMIIVRDDGNVFSHVHPVGTFSMAAQTSLEGRMNIADSKVQEPDAAAFRDSVDLVIKKLNVMPEQQREEYLMSEMMSMTGMGMPMSHNSDETPGRNGMMLRGSGNTVSFPYTFESPGKYRIWVQFKKDEKIYTGVFDRIVK